MKSIELHIDKADLLRRKRLPNIELIEIMRDAGFPIRWKANFTALDRDATDDDVEWDGHITKSHRDSEGIAGRFIHILWSEDLP